MKKYIRSLQKTGGNSILVYLPKDWANKNNLHSLSVVSVKKQKNGSLLITPENNCTFRSLQKSGNSVSMILPREWTYEKNIDEKCYVIIEQKGKQLIIKKRWSNGKL